MMPTMAIRFWREGLIAILTIITYMLYNALTISKLETAQYRDGLEYQNASLLAQKASYDKKLAELPKEIETIKIKYRVIYKNIEDWEGDENATEIENIDDFLSGINY